MVISMHLEGPGMNASLCGEPVKIAITKDILKCDCERCLWKLAQVTLQQLTGALAQLHRLTHPVPTPAPARGGA